MPTTAPTPPLILDAFHPVVARLAELQGTLSDDVFARRHLSCTGATWNKIRAGKYGAEVKDPARMLDKLETDLASLEQAHSVAVADYGAIVPCPFLSLAIKGVRRSFTEPRNRLVVALAPTGGGKTTLARQIADTWHGRVLRTEATETWRKSYLKSCADILAAAGIEPAEIPHSAARAEGALLRLLRAQPRVIVIDEAHYFGPATINLVKAILNQTPCSVVLLAIPDLWHRMNRAAWVESEQLLTRRCAMVDGRTLTARDAAAYLADRLGPWWTPLDPDTRSAIAEAVAERACRFGLWNTLEQVTAELRADLDTQRTARLSAEHAAAALKTLPAAPRR